MVVKTTVDEDSLSFDEVVLATVVVEVVVGFTVEVTVVTKVVWIEIREWTLNLYIISNFAYRSCGFDLWLFSSWGDPLGIELHTRETTGGTLHILMKK